MNEKAANKKLLLRLLVPGLILVIALTWALQDFVREVLIIPLSYFLWLATLIFRSIPQALLWAALLIVVVTIIIKSLHAPRPPLPKTHAPAGERPGRVAVWKKRIHMLRHGEYSRQHFAWHLSGLILEVLAYQERLNPQDIERALETSALTIPPEVSAYIEARRRSYFRQRTHFFARLRQRIRRYFQSERRQSSERTAIGKPDPSTPHSETLESVLQFLEEQLEVPHDT